MVNEEEYPSIKKNALGAIEYQRETETRSVKEVFFPNPEEEVLDLFYEHTPERNQELYENMQRKVTNGTIATCKEGHATGHPDYYYFLPAFIASFYRSGQATSYEGSCFSNVTFIMETDPAEGDDYTSITVHIHAVGKRNFFCKDYFLISTGSKMHVEFVHYKADHTVVLKNIDANDRMDVAANGLQLYMFCEGLSGEIVSLIKTAKLFLGGFG